LKELGYGLDRAVNIQTHAPGRGEWAHLQTLWWWRVGLAVSQTPLASGRLHQRLVTSEPDFSGEATTTCLLRPVHVDSIRLLPVVYSETRNSYLKFNGLHPQFDECTPLVLSDDRLNSASQLHASGGPTLLSPLNTRAAFKNAFDL
jgi:hypothetical protein